MSLKLPTFNALLSRCITDVIFTKMYRPFWKNISHMSLLRQFIKKTRFVVSKASRFQDFTLASKGLGNEVGQTPQSPVHALFENVRVAFKQRSIGNADFSPPQYSKFLATLLEACSRFIRINTNETLLLIFLQHSARCNGVVFKPRA